MRAIVCNGRRMGKAATAAVMDAVGQSELGETMRSLGYRLEPMRAPRGLVNGDLVLRMTWSKTEDNAAITVRSTVRLRAPR